MIVLGIETSCDETALSLIDGRDGTDITVLADKTLSQIELHKQYGGVFPNMAKREHGANLIPLLKTVLGEAEMLTIDNSQLTIDLGSKVKGQWSNVSAILDREPELLEQFLQFIPTIEKPTIDAIAVTEGPGLEPCLWTGVNLARALSFVWDIPVIPVNHMEGHIFSALLRKTEISNSPNYLISKKNPKNIQYQISNIKFPAIALLISGGHTELVLMKDWFTYEIVGQTRDDAVGEAFDKVARLLGLPYPGGPEISRLAEQERFLIHDSRFIIHDVKLPRPMLHSQDLDFSFSGLKTAVLYLLQTYEEKKERLGSSFRDSPRSFSVSLRLQSLIAREFENAITEVLVAKTAKALERFGAQSLIIGGGVIANTHIRRAFEDLAFTHGREQMLNGDFLHIPEKQLTTDNALMIAVAGYFRIFSKNDFGTVSKRDIKPKGNLALGE